MKKLIITLCSIVFCQTSAYAKTSSFVCDLKIDELTTEWFVKINTTDKIINIQGKQYKYKDEEDKIKWKSTCKPKPGIACMNDIGQMNKYTGFFFHAKLPKVWQGNCKKAPDKKLF